MHDDEDEFFVYEDGWPLDAKVGVALGCVVMAALVGIWFWSMP